MELQRIWSVLRRSLWVILAAALLAGTGALVVSLRQTKLYRATAVLYINQGEGGNSSIYDVVLASQQVAASYARLATSRPILATAAGKLGVDGLRVATDCTCLLNGRSRFVKFTSDVPLNTQLVTVTAEAPSAAVAATAANAAAAAFADSMRAQQLGGLTSAEQGLTNQLQALQSQMQDTDRQIQSISGAQSDPAEAVTLSNLKAQLADEQTSYASLEARITQARADEIGIQAPVRVAEQAVPPSTPASPNKILNTAAGALLGLVLAIGAVLGIEYVDDHVHTAADLELRAPGIPLLGVIQQFDLRRRKGSPMMPAGILAPSLAPSPEIEEYRVLRSNLQFASASENVRALAVTSPSPREGKSSTASNLAIMLAQTGKSVLLVDADLRKPSLHRLFDLPNTAGLSTLFLDTGAMRLEHAVSQYGNLRVLTSGPRPPNPTELLGSERMRKILALLCSTFDHIVIDTPPLLAVADTAEIAAQVDGVILVADAAATHASALLHSRAVLERLGRRPLGVVLNRVPASRLREHSYYGGYEGYTYGPTETDGRGTAGPADGRLAENSQNLRA